MRVWGFFFVQGLDFISCTLELRLRVWGFFLVQGLDFISCTLELLERGVLQKELRRGVGGIVGHEGIGIAMTRPRPGVLFGIA